MLHFHRSDQSRLAGCYIHNYHCNLFGDELYYPLFCDGEYARICDGRADSYIILTR